jgi:hypothetical protein
MNVARVRGIVNYFQSRPTHSTSNQPVRLRTVCVTMR